MNYGQYQYQNPNPIMQYPYQNTPQQRLQALEQQYMQSLQMQQQNNSQMQPQPMQQPQQIQQPIQQFDNQFNIIFVNSEDEARKQMPDITGAVQIFAHRENDKVIKFYTKQINTDNLEVKFESFEKIIQMPTINVEEEVTKRNELEELANNLCSKIDNLNIEILEIKEAIKHESTTKQRTTKTSTTKSTNGSSTAK